MEKPNAFIHGGRIGDLFFALYTIKMLGGGDLDLIAHHTLGWDFKVFENVESLLKQQSYINNIYWDYLPSPETYKVYDLINAERQYNPKDFPEWDGKPWPSNINIVKRYAQYFGVEYPPKEPWIKVEPFKKPFYDVVMHYKESRWGSNWGYYYNIKRFLEDEGIRVLSIQDDYFNRENLHYIETAQHLAGAKIYIGSASSVNACAEAMGIPTFVSQPEDCFNINPTVSLNKFFQSKDAITEIMKYVR